MSDLGLFGRALKAQEPKFKANVAAQEAVYNLTAQKYAESKTFILKQSLHLLATDAAHLSAVIVTAAKARPLSIELYANLVKDLTVEPSPFCQIVRRTLWTGISHPSVQFLVALLLDNGVLTADWLLLRARHSNLALLSEELLFYFLPEWSTCPWFCAMQIERQQAKLQKWDRKFTSQCREKLNGHDLGANRFSLFREYRSKGYNHHAVAQCIVRDDVAALTELVTNGTVTVDDLVPLSIFDRFVHGKRARVTLIEYCALAAKAACFRYLVNAGAKLPDSLTEMIAFGGAGEMVRACESAELPFDKAILPSLRGYHVSMMRYIEDTFPSITPDGRAVLEMCRFRYKGMHYLIWLKGINVGNLLAADPKLSESLASVYNDLLIDIAWHNDPFLTRTISQSAGFDVMKPTNRKYSTALHAAAAGNSVEALGILLSASGADANVSDRSGTPLICAAQQNAWEAAIVLIHAQSIDVNAISQDVPSLFRGLLSWPLVNMAALLS
jgi:hypothetical protein